MNFFNNFNIDTFFSTIPLLGLYAETNFRFRFPFNRFFTREAELIFDTPWRLEPGQCPTIFLVIHDAKKHPLTLKQVEITIQQMGSTVGTQSWELHQYTEATHDYLEFVIEAFSIPVGNFEVFPTLIYEVNGKEKKMLVDNYPQISKPPLRVNHSGQKLPTLPGWVNGETHLHTDLTNDQIEFGASIEMTRKSADLFGMDYITATDHSYDLDDSPDDYLKNDPALKKWHESRDFINAQNTKHHISIIPGEEISVSNQRGSTVHFLHFNDSVYFPGSGDGGDKWPDLSSEHSIDDILSLRSKGTISVAAHTSYQFPFLPRVLLKRGTWEAEDHMNPKLDGVQILCGTPASSSFQDSRQLWIEALLTGKRLAVYGGSDSHGNFNRNWHVKIPLWSLGIHEDQIFGQSRTLLRSKTTGVDNLIQAMQNKRTAVTTGPVGDLIIQNDNETYHIGDIIKVRKEKKVQINCMGLSSPEFGPEMDLTVYYGSLPERQETIIHHKVDLYEKFELSLPFELSENSYIRMEISSDGARWPGVYLSSPIWIEITQP